MMLQHATRQPAPSFEIALPLHGDTHSAIDVATLVERVMSEIERYASDRPALASSDVEQALGIVAAVRSAHAEACRQLGSHPRIRLQAIDLE